MHNDVTVMKLRIRNIVETEEEIEVSRINLTVCHEQEHEKNFIFRKANFVSRAKLEILVKPKGR